MDGWNDVQLDWMRHLKRLNVDRVEKPKFLNVHDVKRLEWEIETQQAVLDRIAADKPLDGLLIVMARYMRKYADLHIEWYGRKLDDGAFRAGVLAAKDRLWKEIRHAKTEKRERVAPDVEAVFETAAAQGDVSG